MNDDIKRKVVNGLALCIWYGINTVFVWREGHGLPVGEGIDEYEAVGRLFEMLDELERGSAVA